MNLFRQARQWLPSLSHDVVALADSPGIMCHLKQGYRRSAFALGRTPIRTSRLSKTGLISHTIRTLLSNLESKDKGKGANVCRKKGVNLEIKAGS